MYIYYQKLQLVEHINLFQNVEDDIQRNLFEQHLHRMYMEVLLSDINQIPTGK